MALDLDISLRQNRPALESERAGRWLLYSPGCREVSVLSPAGKRVWDAFGRGCSPRLALRGLARDGGLDGVGLPAVLGLIQGLAERRLLLAEGAETADPADPEPPIPSPGRDPLVSLYIHLTNRCNLRCIYCYNGRYRAAHQDRDELSGRELLGLVEQAAVLGVRSLVFTGGEPLLRRETLEAGCHARALGLRTSCLTNGTRVRRNAAAVAAAFDGLVISLDSWRPEENARIRVGSRLEEIVRGTRALVTAGAKVSIRPVITRHNVGSLAGFPEWADRELGCRRFLLALCSPTLGEDLDLLRELPSPATYRRALRGFQEALERVRGEPEEGAGPAIKRVGRCGAGTGILSVAPNGDVFPCQCLHRPELNAGNLRRQTLAEIWRRSPVLDRLRRGPPQPFTRCAHCPVAGLCSLNCRAVHLAFAPVEAAFTGALCPYARIEAEERLWWEAERRAAG